MDAGCLHFRAVEYQKVDSSSIRNQTINHQPLVIPAKIDQKFKPTRLTPVYTPIIKMVMIIKIFGMFFINYGVHVGK